ncbi:MAG: hypothetical protein ACTSWX_04085 [Promethearchaeota archaeon]
MQIWPLIGYKGKKFKIQEINLIMIIRRNEKWIKWADYFDREINKILEDNPGKWMTLQIEVNQETWNEIKDVPEDPIEKLSLIDYLKGFTFKMIRMEEIKVITDTSVDVPKGEYFKIKIVQKN